MTSESASEARRRELEQQERILREREVELRLREMEVKIHTADEPFHQTIIAFPKQMKYTPPALSRTLPLARGGLGRGHFVPHQSGKGYKHQPENFQKPWMKKLILGGKLFALGVVALVAVKIASVVAGFIIIAALGLMSYKLFFESQKTNS